MRSQDTRALWSLSCTVPAADAPFVEACLEPLCESLSVFVVEEDRILRVEGITPEEPDPALLRAALAAAFPGGNAPEPAVAAIPPRDWLKENIVHFPPLRLGRFFIHGSHFEGEPPLGTLPLWLDAATAFGSGEHGSTAGCLQALQDLARAARPAVALDLGCGSGILAIALAKLFRIPVVATDIDPEAVRVAALNALQNDVGHLITAVTAKGYASPVVRAAAPYDIIMENILARPIRRLSKDLARHLAPGGYAVLAGLVVRDAPLVITAHRRQGLKLVRHITINGWRTLVFRKPFSRAGI